MVQKSLVITVSDTLLIKILIKCHDHYKTVKFILAKQSLWIQYIILSDYQDSNEQESPSFSYLHMLQDFLPTSLDPLLQIQLIQGSWEWIPT